MNIEENIELNNKTTMRVGGPARYFVSAQSVDDIVDAVNFAREKELPIFVLGSGSNVLVSDVGFLGVVIQMNIKGVTYDGNKVTASSGENWDEFVQNTLEHNLYGLENLSYIPGTVGASPIQNIGAYGVEVEKYIKEVKVVNKENGEIETLINAECEFEYRNSIFKKEKGKKYIVVSVKFELNTELSVDISYKDLEKYFENKNTPMPSEVRRAVIEIRKNKLPDPSEVGTVGSFFKNPIITKEHFSELQAEYSQLPSYNVDESHVKIPLAWVLDKILGLKGFQKGNVKLHDRQPIAIVNVGGATMNEIKTFADDIAEKVFEKTKIKIEYEVREVK